MRRRPLLPAALAVLVLAPLAGQSPVPPGAEGEYFYVPFPVSIVADGDLSDWAGIPSYTVTKGPQVSGDPKENGSFTFSVAADANTLYIFMTMPDEHIVAGAHGTDYWNEDSLEFFLNLSGNPAAKAYGPGIVQVNVNATTLDTPGAPLSLSGVGWEAQGYYIEGSTFRIPGGWGFEAAFDLTGRVTPAHGLSIGFQAQANGATKTNRDVKLIWSAFDTADRSWQDPRLFGTAVFYELGRTDAPPPAEKVLPPVVVDDRVPQSARGPVRINQLGYPAAGRKIAVLAHPSLQPLPWALQDRSGQTVAEGLTEVYRYDIDSGQNLHRIDFSDYAVPGTRYVLRVKSAYSPEFAIAADPAELYGPLARDAMAYFTLSRAGIRIDASVAGDAWARDAWYVTDDAVAPFAGTDAHGIDWPGGDYLLDAGKGWFDAGDYGKYAVNGAVSAWALGNMAERNRGIWPDGSLPVPEGDNGVPDVLDEMGWEIAMLLGLQVPEGEPGAGMVHHKVHEVAWDPFPMPGSAASDARFAFVPSTSATLDTAAAAAQYARLVRRFDRPAARTALRAAVRAWRAAETEPVFLYGDIPGSGGGNYDDAKIADERFWAACELWLTTGRGVYRRAVRDYLAGEDWRRAVGSADAALSWQETALAGAVSVSSGPKRIFGRRIRRTIDDGLTALAGLYRKAQSSEGFRVSLVRYRWGSNSEVLNKALVTAVAADIAASRRQRDEAADLARSAAEAMDYVLGRNVLGESFVTGYGAYPAKHPHHRWWAADADAGYPPPPPGVLVGGPNEDPADPAAEPTRDAAPAARYVDDRESFTTNEVAINWNAPLAWMAGWMTRAGF